MFLIFVCTRLFNRAAFSVGHTQERLGGPTDAGLPMSCKPIGSSLNPRFKSGINGEEGHAIVTCKAPAAVGYGGSL